MIKKVGNVRTENNTVLVSIDHLDESNNFNISHVEICDLYYKSQDINFLNRCVNIEHLTLNHHYIPDLSVLYNLRKIKKLDLIENMAKPKLDLSELKSLETLYYHWAKSIKGVELIPIFETTSYLELYF